MEKGITFVGMDAHKVAIKQAVLLPGQTKPVEWQLANEKAVESNSEHPQPRSLRVTPLPQRRLRMLCCLLDGHSRLAWLKPERSTSVGSDA